MKPFDIEKFSGRRVLVVGDFMIDEYLWGDVDRISPEAPVQVLEVKREEFMLGGAGNVVRNLAKLGADVAAVGAAGVGHDGQMLLDLLEKLRVDVSGIFRDNSRPTTRKTRILAAHQHVLRIDRETKADISDRVFQNFVQTLTSQIPEADIVIISDYGKGTVTRALIAKIVRICKKYEKPVIADPKGLDFKKYAGVTLITPNTKEASLASNIDIVDDRSMRQAASVIMEKTETDKLLITCGKDGMALFEDPSEPFRIRSEARQVFDVSGAGDTVIAVLGLAMASGASLRQAAELANAAAGIVVGIVGAAAVTRKQLARAMAKETSQNSSKYVEPEDLKDLADSLRKSGKKIIFTNGCFDLIHCGHILLFSESKRLGDILVVAIDDDRSVRKLKGPPRPVISQDQRAGIIAALDSVDYVTVFPSDGLAQIIDALRPDILTKGSNYTEENVFGRELVEKHGGQIRLIPVSEDVSATTIIERIKNGACPS